MFRDNLFSYATTKLALATAAAFLLQSLFTEEIVLYYFALIPNLVVHKKFLWQLLSYLFLHNGVFHLLINMYLLIMFGTQVEESMGARRFLFFYFFCGIGAGIVIFLVGVLFNNPVPTIGASGAIYGVLVAFAFFYPDVHILLFFIIPVKAKYLVLFYVLYELYLYMYSSGGNVSYTGHLGGILFAFIYFLIWGRGGRSILSKAKSVAEKSKERAEAKKQIEENTRLKQEILKKLKVGHTVHQLTDDEAQYIRYCSIMFEESIPFDENIEQKAAISDHEFISAARAFAEEEI